MITTGLASTLNHSALRPSTAGTPGRFRGSGARLAAKRLAKADAPRAHHRPGRPRLVRPAPVVLVQVRRVRVTQRAQVAGARDGGGEAVAAEQVQIAVLERAEPGDVLLPALVALGFQLGDGGVDAAGRPEHDGACGRRR